MTPQMEHKLAVMTVWAWLGPFGLSLALSGFRMPDFALGLAGFGLILAAGCGHVIINHIYSESFKDSEAALGFGIFAISLLVFALTWVVAPDFGLIRIGIGLIGFSALFAALVFYLVVRFGVRGTIAQIDAARRRPLLVRR